jgi:multiple sugar transport system permease protein
MNTRRLSGDARWVLLLLYLMIVLAPLLWFFTISIKKHVDAIAYPPIVRFQPIASNYLELLQESQFSRALTNSAVVGLGTVLVSFLIGVPAAYALSHRRIRRQRQVLVAVLTLRMMPRIVFIVPFFIVLRALGLTDTRLGLILTYQTFTLPFFVWTIQPFFEGVPVSLEESARGRLWCFFPRCCFPSSRGVTPRGR